MDTYISIYIVFVVLLISVCYLLFKPSKLSLFYNKNINNIKIYLRTNNLNLDESVVCTNIPTVKWLDFLLSKSPSLSGKNPFYPTPWIRGGHLQTFYASVICHKGKIIQYEREILSLEDGGQVALDWYPDRPNNNESRIPTVIILHGLTGNSQTGYCRSVIKKLSNKNRFRCVVFNYRGCGGVEVLTPRTYNGGDTRDLKEVLNHLHNISPSMKLFAVGFSLGANILVKYLGEEGENSLISGAMSIANPLNFIDISRLFKSQFIQKKIYNPNMALDLLTLHETHPIIKATFIKRKWKGIRQFDRDITIKVGGFPTVNDYYRWASSDQYITRVRVPLLLLNAKDDPVSPKVAIPYHECKYNPYVLLATTNHGGHIGWYEGLTPRHWFSPLILEYLMALNEAVDLNVPSKFIK